MKNLHGKKEYIVQIKTFKKTLILRLVLIEVYRVINVNQEVWLKLYVFLNLELTKNEKYDFQKGFSSLRTMQSFFFFKKKKKE